MNACTIDFINQCLYTECNKVLHEKYPYTYATNAAAYNTVGYEYNKL